MYNVFWSYSSPTTPNSSKIHPPTTYNVVFFLSLPLIIHRVQFVLSTPQWIWGHPLEHG